MCRVAVRRVLGHAVRDAITDRFGLRLALRACPIDVLAIRLAGAIISVHLLVLPALVLLVLHRILLLVRVLDVLLLRRFLKDLAVCLEIHGAVALGAHHDGGLRLLTDLLLGDDGLGNGLGSVARGGRRDGR